MRDLPEVAHPLGGVVAWLGGKRSLGPQLAGLIDASSHVCYAEPFIGMGGVFFRRRRRPAAEAINDRSRDVATLFRVLQRHPAALFAELDRQVAARAEFDRQLMAAPETLTDIERAARLVYLQTCGFGGKVADRSFGRATTRCARFYWPRLERRFRAIAERLAGVHIDCLDFADFITRWDRPHTLFYLDPPYIGCEQDYGAGLFSREDFGRLAAALGGLRGRFILTIGDHPDARRLFARFRIEPAQVARSLDRRGVGRRSAAELIISG